MELTCLGGIVSVVAGSLFSVESSVQHFFGDVLVYVHLCVQIESTIILFIKCPSFSVHRQKGQANLFKVHVGERDGQLLFVRSLRLDPLTHRIFDENVAVQMILTGT